MKLLMLFAILVGTVPIFSQEDNCDPTTFTGNSWLEKKRSEYGKNCMQYMLNRTVSNDHNGAVNISLGGGAYKPTPWMEEFKKITCNAAGGCWSSTIRQPYRSMATYHDQNDVPIYARPIFLENFGDRMVVTSYSTPFDTTWLKYDPEEIREYIEDQFDMPDGMSIAMNKHIEEEKVFYKVTGTIEFGKDPIEPSTMADLIAKFGNSWMYHLIYKLHNVEIEYVHALLKKKHPYYKRQEFQGLFNMERFAIPGWNGKEGVWNFTRQNGKKNCLIESDGNELRMYIQIKADEKKIAAVAEKMKEWVKKNPFDEAKSTEVLNYGSPVVFWVKITVDPSKYSGEDLKEDVYGEFFADYGDEVIEEVEDTADDIK